jgi:amino acid adenylation domain-containing protein
VARGYLDDPGLTAERFVPDPWSAEPGARMYRTGDRALWQLDGRIAYLGRLDRQVKIRGQRVEVGEVEAVLTSHPRIEAAAVIVSARAGLPQLVAYVTPSTAPEPPDVVQHCARLLPSQLVPSRVVRLDSLPLTVAGKVDVAALGGLAPDDAQPAGSARPPRTFLERAVAAAWSRAFGGPDPDLSDDFFAQSGHSIIAMRLVAALRADLGRDVSVEDVLAGRTVAGLTRRVEQAGPLEEAVTVPGGSRPTLSPLQRQLWFVEQLAPDTPAHNISLAERLRGRLRTDALREALRELAERHEVLRWRIVHARGASCVLVDPPSGVPLPVEDLSGIPSAARDSALRGRLQDEARRSFDLASGPLWRARLLRLGDDDHVLALTLHHAVFDGWSQHLLWRELSACYGALVAGRRPALSSLPATFADYVAWLHERDRRGSAAALAWWADHLAGAPTTVDLPRDRARPSAQTFRGAEHRADVPARVAAQVRALAHRLGATTYTVLLAAFGQLLRRLTGQDDLLVGAPLADRGDRALESVVGCCVQVLPLRLRVPDDSSFAEHVEACRDELSDAMAHAGPSLQRLVETLAVPRDLSRGPLVQVVFNMYDFAGSQLDLPGVVSEPLPPGLPGSMFDLTLYASERAEGLSLQVVYNPDLYSAERIAALVASYGHVLAQLVADPDRRAGEASLRAPSNELPDWTTSLAGWDGPGLVERVREMARTRPHDVAVAGAGGQLTYQGVEESSRRTAAMLRAAGLRTGQVVGVLARRDSSLPAILLGVLASGARWAVLDASLPPAVLRRQACAAGVRALACCSGDSPPEALAHLPVIEGAPPRQTSPRRGPALDARGYVAFTSGTTGDSKPVLTPERPLAHFLDWYPRAFALGPSDRFALLSGLSHDPVLRDAFVPLTLGGRLCVPEQGWLRDPDQLARWLRAEEVSVVHLTPQHALLLTAARDVRLPALRLVGLGGDQLTGGDVDRVRRAAPNARIVNLYGTTETPQVAAFYEVEGAVDGPEPVPVGRGAAGAQLLVLGPHGRPAAVGELGEVVIRSRHLAAGYLDGELSRRRFRRTPGSDRADRIYHTGDLGRHRPGGDVVLAGRSDRQVKVRGHRVELGAVEAALTVHADVRTAVALAMEEGRECEVAAYVQPAHAAVRVEELREHLRGILPDYALPSRLRLLAALPLTPNGKVDQDALRRLAFRRADEPPHEFLSRTERIIADTWREVLRVPRVRAGDNFFEIGGHSLAIVTVRARLSELLDREIAIVDLFRYPSIRALASHLEGGSAARRLDRAANRAADRRRRAGHRRASRPAPSRTGQASREGGDQR